ncbi:MAG: hypothetical protein HZB16_24640 [Armatimonadetes bacterium]|nr:hypothetical protein [Armatimonadota bacterium]
MDSKKTLWSGAGLLVVGLLLCMWQKHNVMQLLGGLIALVLLLAGCLFVFMGVLEAKEDAATRAKDVADAAKADEMAAKE